MSSEDMPIWLAQHWARDSKVMEIRAQDVSWGQGMACWASAFHAVKDAISLTSLVHELRTRWRQGYG